MIRISCDYCGAPLADSRCSILHAILKEENDWPRERLSFIYTRFPYSGYSLIEGEKRDHYDEIMLIKCVACGYEMEIVR